MPLQIFFPCGFGFDHFNPLTSKPPKNLGLSAVISLKRGKPARVKFRVNPHGKLNFFP